MGQCQCKDAAKPSKITEAYEIGPHLGAGTYGEVRKCTHRHTGEVYAVKIMGRKPNETGKWSSQEMFKREVTFLKCIKNPQVIKYVGHHEDRRNLYMVMEYCEGGQLFHHIATNKRLEEVTAVVITKQMLEAVAYLHACNVVHRDIKAENFLLTNLDTLEVKLIDFGMSTVVSSEETVLTEICGSAHYLAPELIKHNYSIKADMWAFGVLVYLLLYGRYPYTGSTPKQIMTHILTQPINYAFDGGTPLSPECLDFIQSLLERDPKKRLSSKDALQHPWIVNNSMSSEKPPLKTDLSSASTTDPSSTSSEC